MSGRHVALRKESVDRNQGQLADQADSFAVALRKESVDRNHSPAAAAALWSGSLSARRAWIEMPEEFKARCVRDVALRKESVDRNPKAAACVHKQPRSLSARRAWIEIAGCG